MSDSKMTVVYWTDLASGFEEKKTHRAYVLFIS